jgi:hypothetical protein
MLGGELSKTHHRCSSEMTHLWSFRMFPGFLLEKARLDTSLLCYFPVTWLASDERKSYLTFRPSATTSTTTSRHQRSV